MSKSAPNEHLFREPWLHAALAQLKPHFELAGLKFPERIRCAFGLTSGGTKSTRKSECWPASASVDHHCEIFISPDIAEPFKVLAELCHAGLHACLKPGIGHGPEFKEAALKFGMQAPPSKDEKGNRLPNSGMRHPEPTPRLSKILQEIAGELGPLPHAKLNLSSRVLDRGEETSGEETPRSADVPKKQAARMHKVFCPDCQNKEKQPYVLRMAREAMDRGLPLCPRHGVMQEEIKKGKANGNTEAVEPVAEAAPQFPDPVIIVPPPPPVEGMAGSV